MLNRNLELFIQIAECGSITKVAKTHYITQPAVSNALAKLEHELGIRLFSRDKRSGLRLTDAGKQILSYAKQMEDLDNRMKQAAYQAKNLLGGRVRVAVLTSLISTILSKPLQEYRRRYPHIDIELKEGTPNDIFAMIEDHSADFAISCSPFGAFPAIPLVHDCIQAIYPPGFKEKTALSLQHPPDLLIINRPAYETILDHLSAGSSVKLEKILFVQNAETAIRMVEDGVGIGILSRYTLETLAPHAARYPVLPEIPFDIGLFANDLTDIAPAAAELLRMIRRATGANPE